MRLAPTLLVLSGLLFSEAAQSQDDPVRAWFAETSVPLNSVEPESGISDLAPYGEMVGDARIVGIGEPTHGNHEIYRLKHRLFEYLVREKGYTHLGIEAPFAEATYLNDYVVYGTGSAEEALSYTTMWAWDVEEVAVLLDWMREWNADLALEHRLRIFGFDIQSPERAAREVLDALEELNPELAISARRDLGTLAIPFLDQDGMGYRPLLASEADSSALITARAIVKFLDGNVGNWNASLRDREASRLLQLSRNLLWWVEANHGNGDEYNRIRDRAMAANVDWVLGQAGTDAKAALWAHNVHLADLNAERLGGIDMAGRFLKRSHGENYVIVGTFFANGTITALEASPWGEVRTFATGQSEPNYLEAQLPENMAVALVDLGDIPPHGPVRSWFDQPQRTRHSGGGYTDDGYAYATFDYLLPEAFDILAIVKESTATRPVSPQDTVRVRPLSATMNLDFEDVSEGTPRDWVVWSKQHRWGYRVVSASEGSPQGERHARLCRLPGAIGVDVGGTLVQYIDANVYRGADLTISAMTSADLAEGASAYFRIKIEPYPSDNVHSSAGAIDDTLNRHPIDQEDWGTQSATIPVPDHAGYIMFGVSLIGEGCVSIDNVRLEVGSRPVMNRDQ